jgi:hypothetical protein
MRATFTQLLLLSSTVFLAIPALHAQTRDAALPASIARWTKAVNMRLDQVIAAPVDLGGAASATFRRGDDGRIADVRIFAANPRLTEAARTTLRRLGWLPPMPTGVDPRQLIRVNLLFQSWEDGRSFMAKRRAMIAAAEAANRRLEKHLADRSLALSNAP